jgi:phage N-6-adenine-methyltransferase
MGGLVDDVFANLEKAYQICTEGDDPSTASGWVPESAVAKDLKALFSHAKDNWRTPIGLYQQLKAEFDFVCDAAADESNHLCDAWYGPGSIIGECAIGVEKWAPCCWLNPPYSQVKHFIQKAADQRLLGVTTVPLIPSRTDTKWWHSYIWDAELNQCRPGISIRFIKGRLKFSGSTNSAPFPSVIVVFSGTSGASHNPKV